MRGVLHDLRGPVRRTAALLELLGEQAKDGASRKLLHTARGELVTLEPLFVDLAALARVPDPVATPANLADVAARLRYEQRQRLTAAGADLSFDLPSHAVQISEAALVDVFTRLIDNSLRFAGSAVRIEITHIPNGAESARIRFKDSGPGIPSEYCESVFEPFARLHGREIPGHGLGLTICRKLLSAVGGSISIYPGDCFHAVISIPMAR